MFVGLLTGCPSSCMPPRKRLIGRIIYSIDGNFRQCFAEAVIGSNFKSSTKSILERDKR